MLIDKGNISVDLSLANRNLTCESVTLDANTNRDTDNKEFGNTSNYEFDVSAYTMREKMHGTSTELKKKLDINTNDALLINENLGKIGQVNINTKNISERAIEPKINKDIEKINIQKEIAEILKEEQKNTQEQPQNSTINKKPNNKPNFKIKKVRPSIEENQLNNIDTKKTSSK